MKKNKENKENKENKLDTILIAVILVIVFSFWNSQIIEAKVDTGSLGWETKEEILWLARVIYSETKKESEQVLVAWVVRNRVETNFNGNSYREVATSRGQFSGLNVSDLQYIHNISRNYDSGGESWSKALQVAEAVYSSPVFLRPFSKTVRHFYSPISTSVDPAWSGDLKPTLVVRGPYPERHIRFAFYDSVK